MTEIERRLEAAGMRIKPLVWGTQYMRLITENPQGILYYINQTFGSDSYYFATVCRGDGATLYDGEDLPEAKAAADAHHIAAVFAQLEVVE